MTYKFIEWLPVNGPDFLQECAVLKRFNNGEISFVPLASLDKIDMARLKSIITSRSSQLHNELYNLLAEQFLGNGENALSYYHQLAKILSPNGQVRGATSNQMYSAQIPAMQTQQPQMNEPQPFETAPSFDQVAKPVQTAKK
jgi:hypothetical protein